MFAPSGLLGMAALLLVSLLGGSPEAQAAPEDVARDAVENYFRPGYARLSSAARSEADALAALCAAPGPGTLADARKGFASLVDAHARVEFVRFGPIAENNGIERFLFWPDRKGLAQRQVQAILAGRDESATRPETLREKSVAVGGLNALEFVLFGTGADDLSGPNGAFRCRYGAAIGANLAGLASGVAAAWNASNGIADRLMGPKPADPTYRAQADVVAEIVGTLVHGIEAMRDLRLKPALGAGPHAAKPNLFLYRRSSLTASALAANVEGFAALFGAARLADLLAPEQRWIGPSAELEFETVSSTLARVRTPLADAVSDPDSYRTLSALVVETSGLQDLFDRQMAPALGVSAGFSSLDGD